MKKVYIRVATKRCCLNKILEGIAGTVLLGGMVFTVLCWAFGVIR